MSPGSTLLEIQSMYSELYPVFKSYALLSHFELVNHLRVWGQALTSQSETEDHFELLA